MTFVRPQRSRWKRYSMLLLGWLFLLVGLIGGLLPILPGWPFGVAGIIILSKEHEWAHRLVEWIKMKFPRFGRIMEKSSQESHRIIKKFLGRDVPEA